CFVDGGGTVTSSATAGARKRFVVFHVVMGRGRAVVGIVDADGDRRHGPEQADRRGRDIAGVPRIVIVCAVVFAVQVVRAAADRDLLRGRTGARLKCGRSGDGLVFDVAVLIIGLEVAG